MSDEPPRMVRIRSISSSEAGGTSRAISAYSLASMCSHASSSAPTHAASTNLPTALRCTPPARAPRSARGGSARTPRSRPAPIATACRLPTSDAAARVATGLLSSLTTVADLALGIAIPAVVVLAWRLRILTAEPRLHALGPMAIAVMLYAACHLTRVNPKMLPRLDELEADLENRKKRASIEGWLGEIEGIDRTLQCLRDKRADALRLTRITHQVNLGMPTITTPR